MRVIKWWGDRRQISWIEEKVCALHHVSADISCLHNLEHDNILPYRLVGGSCAHPANICSTTRVLPRLPADMNGNLTIVFVGALSTRRNYLLWSESVLE